MYDVTSIVTTKKYSGYSHGEGKTCSKADVTFEKVFINFYIYLMVTGQRIDKIDLKHSAGRSCNFVVYERS